MLAVGGYLAWLNRIIRDIVKQATLLPERGSHPTVLETYE